LPDRPEPQDPRGSGLTVAKPRRAGPLPGLLDDAVEAVIG